MIIRILENLGSINVPEISIEYWGVYSPKLSVLQKHQPVFAYQKIPEAGGDKYFHPSAMSGTLRYLVN